MSKSGKTPEDSVGSVGEATEDSIFTTPPFRVKIAAVGVITPTSAG